jgi:hypothetical protein
MHRLCAFFFFAWMCNVSMCELYEPPPCLFSQATRPESLSLVFLSLSLSLSLHVHLLLLPNPTNALRCSSNFTPV